MRGQLALNDVISGWVNRGLIRTFQHHYGTSYAFMRGGSCLAGFHNEEVEDVGFKVLHEIYNTDQPDLRLGDQFMFTAYICNKNIRTAVQSHGMTSMFFIMGKVTSILDSVGTEILVADPAISPCEVHLAANATLIQSGMSDSGVRELIEVIMREQVGIAQQ